MKRILSMLLVATVVVACTEATVDEPKNDASGADKIYATIADINIDGDDTRVELNKNLQTVWNAGDQIMVYYNNLMREYTFDGKDGDRSGSFTQTANYMAPDSRVTYDKYYAVHLYTGRYGWYSDGSPVFYITIPTTQNYKKGSYGSYTNAMLGTSQDGTNFTFKNILGYLRLSLTGDKMVKSIDIKNNSGSYITGEIACDKDAKCISWYSIESDTITIDCGEGVQLTDVATDFYITLPPVTLSEGISVTVNFTDGTVFPKSTTKSIAITRNTIQPMSVFDTGGTVEWQVVTIEHTGSKISAPTLSGSTSISGYIYWGDDYMSEINSTTSYVYDDGEASHTVTIRAMGATSISINDFTGISEIDLSKF